jgi:hypothetical protein
VNDSDDDYIYLVYYATVQTNYFECDPTFHTLASIRYPAQTVLLSTKIGMAHKRLFIL